VTQTPVIPALLTDFQGRPAMDIAVDGRISEFVIVDSNGTPVADRTYPVYNIVLAVSATWFAAQATWQVTGLTLDVL